jgi:hypothetical protein
MSRALSAPGRHDSATVKTLPTHTRVDPGNVGREFLHAVAIRQVRWEAGQAASRVCDLQFTEGGPQAALKAIGPNKVSAVACVSFVSMDKASARGLGGRSPNTVR